MGNRQSKFDKNQKEQLLDVKTITIDVNKNDGEFVQFLVGDYPSGYLLSETENIPSGIDKSEYYNTLADAYLAGII